MNDAELITELLASMGELECVALSGPQGRESEEALLRAHEARKVALARLEIQIPSPL